MSSALVRGFADACFGNGADGVYLFNFFEENDTSSFEFVRDENGEGHLENCFFERVNAVNFFENSTKANMGDMYFINTGKDMREFIKFVDHPMVHGCWDTGHANCEGGQYNEIMAVGDELFAIHYNDNHGSKDDHVAPFLGRMNHDEVFKALIDVGFKGYFTLECDSSLIKYNQWTGRRRTFEESSNLREPQLFMQRHIEAMMYDTSKWMLEAYGLFEE